MRWISPPFCLTYFSPSPFVFFFTYMAEKVPLHQSQWICSSFHQPNNLVSHTFMLLGSVCRALHTNPMAHIYKEITYKRLSFTYVLQKCKNVINVKLIFFPATLFPCVAKAAISPVPLNFFWRAWKRIKALDNRQDVWTNLFINNKV